MSKNNHYIFKVANSEQEYTQIHQLNYETFVEEIPQHSKNKQKKLIDKYHTENTYLIVLKNESVIAMMALRDNRPFSLDKKIGEVEKKLPISVKKICEIRLLAVKKEFRTGRVFVGLSNVLGKYFLEKGYDAAVISGTTRELKLYQQLGFIPFAEEVGSLHARYQPMYITQDVLTNTYLKRIEKKTINFLPGPVALNELVMKSFSNIPISHRSHRYNRILNKVKSKLCNLTAAKNVQLLMGSGTLANDCIAAQLSLLTGNGIIIVNGEFGKRLVAHADRFNLSFSTLTIEYGNTILENDVANLMNDRTKWIWFVHSETSTGVLNDLEMMKKIAKQHQLLLCVDCISSLGALSLNLQDVYLASGVSGKAIGALTGLSFVFHNHKINESNTLPIYLDLGKYENSHGIPFSQSSNLLEALDIALLEVNEDKYDKVKRLNNKLRYEIESIGLNVIAKEIHSSPAIITIELPNNLSSVIIGNEMLYLGYLLHYESSYLKERNWLQIACIGNSSMEEVTHMIQSFRKVIEYELRNNDKE